MTKNYPLLEKKQILELIKPFNDILLSNFCDIYQVQTEWDRLIHFRK